MVTYAEELLGIEFIRNSIVGSAEKKGISGGQKKRTSIAMEMMKEAPLFFLDGEHFFVIYLFFFFALLLVFRCTVRCILPHNILIISSLFPAYLFAISYFAFFFLFSTYIYSRTGHFLPLY